MRTHRTDTLDGLFLRYERICETLRSSENEQAIYLAAELVRSVGELKKKMDNSPDKKVRRAAVAGMREGLRDIGTIARLMQEPIRAKLLALADGPESPNELLPGILSRGKIATQDEWNVVRTQLDRIEGHAEFASETEELRRLLDSYERV